ncbi:1470_t:CDS:1, partial [Acaulospora colombiana]
MKAILSNLQLQQYLPTFQRHNIDLKVFLTMNEQTLQSVGVLNETHRRILVICIRKLSQLLATVNLIEELDERLLSPIAEEAPEIFSGDVDYRSPDLTSGDKSDECVPIKPDSPPAYTFESQEIDISPPIGLLTSKNVKSSNPSFGKRSSLLVQGSNANGEDTDGEDFGRRHSMPVLPSYIDAVKGR